jgi:hypothetical protein
VTLLKRMRKYRHRLAGALLPVLTFVWIAAAASPCLPMRASSSDAASRDVAASGSEMASLGGIEPSANQGAAPGSSDPQRPCPHCPPSHGPMAPHVACATLSAFLSSDEALAAPAYDLAHALLPVVDVVALDSIGARKERRRPPDRRPIASPAVPLNLRYCVFLN